MPRTRATGSCLPRAWRCVSWAKGSRSLLYFRNLGSQGLQAIDELTVAALDRLARSDARLSIGGEARSDERHARSQIAAVERAAASQLGRSGDDDAMRVGEEQVGAHAAHLLECEETQLVHPVVHQRPTGGLRGEH